MTATELQDIIAEALYDAEEFFDNSLSIRTFEEEGVLTYNKGLVVKCGNKKFHVTITE